MAQVHLSADPVRPGNGTGRAGEDVQPGLWAARGRLGFRTRTVVVLAGVVMALRLVSPIIIWLSKRTALPPATQMELESRQ